MGVRDQKKVTTFLEDDELKDARRHANDGGFGGVSSWLADLVREAIGKTRSSGESSTESE